MAEYISREDVLANIYATHSCGGFKRECDYLWLHNQVINATTADVQPVNQWVSVDNKLPEWDKTVLVWYASDTLFGASEGYGLSWYHGSWRVSELNGENIRIFYWQYLPEKPKEG